MNVPVSPVAEIKSKSWLWWSVLMESQKNSKLMNVKHVQNKIVIYLESNEINIVAKI